MSCRNCKYYKNKPHTIIWDFDEETEHYAGVCTHPNNKHSIPYAGSCCYLFKKKVMIGPVLGAYNQHKKVGVNVEKEQS